MTVGELAVIVKMDDEFSAKVEDICRRMEAAARGAEDLTIPAALLGAAAAAVLLPKPVSRRALLFPWLRRQAAL